MRYTYTHIFIINRRIYEADYQPHTKIQILIDNIFVNQFINA